MIRYFFILLGLIATPCFAAQTGANANLGMHKSNEPIEINSDALEVLQEEHKAIFTGHVVAIQGDVHLKSEKMTVFYKSTEDTKGKPATGNSKDKPTEKSQEKPSSPLASEKNSIEKILVENNVFLTTAEETASGTHGIYDVENHKIYLNDNVVLTKDKNTIKGDRLVYDFATGKSTMNAPKASDTPLETNTSGKSPRVKALFIPNGDEKLPSKQK